MSGRLLVIGGGAAGMSAASAARRVDPSLEIIVLEATGHAAYGLCGLPYLVSGVIGDASALLAYPPEFFREERNIDLRLGVAAIGIDPSAGTVTCTDGEHEREIGYDHLVVTAGGAPILPPVPGMDAGINGGRIFTVRTLEDAVRLRALLDGGKARRAVVVGAGYIGLEMAEALRARHLEVVVVELLDQVMPNLDPEIAALIETEVRLHGVDLRLQTGLTELRSSATALVAVLDSGAVSTDVIVVATGVRPSGGMAAAAGARTDTSRALLVDRQMRTSLPAVSAAGDCVAHYHRILGRPAFVPLGPAANKTGRVAGTVAAGRDAEFHGILGTAVVKVFDLAVGRTGLTLREARQGGVAALATDVVGRSRAKYYPGSEAVNVRLVHEPGGRLLGAQMVGRSGVAKRIDVVAAALQAGFGVDDLADLDLSYAPPYAPVYEPVLVAAQAAARSGTGAVA
ncbi:MAG: FAD-dependent oxidoreductase [Candidatus Dormibacteraeota bacterium]|nr:FAD-dependent oxidoreductase [Candidatus Dormibacteraeota bacterium]